MSTAEAAHRPAGSGRTLALCLGLLLLVAAAVGLAWIGAGSLRPIVTQSGLQFRTIKAGKGEPIGHDDAALLDYELRTSDGTLFDSSGSQPRPFSMDGTFPGFAEAMSRMQEGGHYLFTMPEKLAGGGLPSTWPKGSPLTFEVRVEKIFRGEAAQLQQAREQQMQQQLEQMQQQQQGQTAPPQQ